MYEDYMQDFFGYPVNGYINTYEPKQDEYCYGYNYNQNPNFYFQNRNVEPINELEDCYPEIYNIVYPMVKKVCSQNRNRPINKQIIDSMVEEVYSNIETNDAVNLNITINNDVRNSSPNVNSENKDKKEENRAFRRNVGLNDLIRILILREILGRPGCIGPNCNLGPRPPMPPYQRPPFPRYM